MANEFQQLEYRRRKNLLGEMRELEKLRKSLSSWVSENCRYLERGLANVAETVCLTSLFSVDISFLVVSVSTSNIFKN